MIPEIGRNKHENSPHLVKNYTFTNRRRTMNFKHIIIKLCDSSVKEKKCKAIKGKKNITYWGEKKEWQRFAQKNIKNDPKDAGVTSLKYWK